MGTLRAKLAVLGAFLLTAGHAGTAQAPDPAAVGDTLRPLLDTVLATAVPQLENESGEDLHREDIRIRLRLNILNVEHDALGLLFGGGKVAADAVAELRLEFRGISATVLDQAIQSATGDPRASLNATFGVPTGRLAVTAEEVRVLGAGLLLAYFQEFEARQAQALLQSTLPGLAVLDLGISWSNVAPFAYLVHAEPNVPQLDLSDPAELADAFAVPPLREPPIVLEARARLNYLDRLSVLGLLSASMAGAQQGETAEDRLKQSLLREQGEPFLEQGAFATLGIAQLVNVSVPVGWRIEVELIVPKGFTIEGSTSELAVAGDHRGAVVVLDGLGRSGDAQAAAVATLSSRFLVTLAALGLLLVAGTVLRLPLEAAVLGLHQVAARRRQRAQRRSDQRRAKP